MKEKFMDQNRTPLLDAVAAYARREPAYFKIPAHRFERGISPRWRKWTGDGIFRFDLTEAEGRDDHHRAERMRRQAKGLAGHSFGTVEGIQTFRQRSEKQTYELK